MLPLVHLKQYVEVTIRELGNNNVNVNESEIVVVNDQIKIKLFICDKCHLWFTWNIKLKKRFVNWSKNVNDGQQH
jgi:hypothetical protein